jgi:hypothetical protein
MFGGCVIVLHFLFVYMFRPHTAIIRYINYMIQVVSLYLVNVERSIN